MAEAIRQLKEIRGITVNGKEIKLSQDGSEASLRESSKLIDRFGEMSGLGLNSKKTEFLWSASHPSAMLYSVLLETLSGHILGDPGAVSRVTGIFVGESLL